MLLIAFCATLSSIRDHARTLSDAVTAGCILKDYIPLPPRILLLCGDAQEVDPRVSILSDRVHRVEGEIAALRAANAVIPMRNFALRGGGATIDASITSPTYKLPARTIQSRLLFWLRGHDHQDAHINLPNVALEEFIEVGECWEFEGGHGTIGVNLPESIHVSSLSLNYIPPSKVSAVAMARAPRNVTLWGHADAENLTEVLSHPERRLFADRLFIPLIRAEYNISDEILLQNFLIVGNSSHEILYSTLILEVTSNWGANTTCLYYVGIHGVSYGE